MLEDRPRLSPVFGFVVLAVAFQIIGDSLETRVWAGAFFVLQAATWALGFLASLSWMADNWSRIADAAHARNVDSREVRLARSVASMTFEQLETFRALMGADMNPVLVDLEAEGKVPKEFVRSLVAQSTGRVLLPGRTFSDGSRNRVYYQTVVDYLTGLGLATAARGNKPAELTVPWRDALEALKDIQE